MHSVVACKTSNNIVHATKQLAEYIGINQLRAVGMTTMKCDGIKKKVSQVPMSTNQ